MSVYTNNRWVLALPVLLLLLLLAVLNAPGLKLYSQQLSYAATIDFLVTVPFVYFLVIRKRAVPNTTVVSVFILCMLIAGFAIPQAHQNLLVAIRQWAIPVVEIAAFSYLLIKLRKAFQQYKQQKKATPDFYTSLLAISQQVFPAKIANLLAFELSVVYYAFGGWKKRISRANEYSYHQRSGSILILGVIMLLILVETFALHLALEQWSVYLAWTLTILSSYSFVQFLALSRSLSKRPIYIDQKKAKLFLKDGFFSETTINLSAIAAVVQTSRSTAKEEACVHLSTLGDFGGHNLVLRLKTEHTLKRAYGMQSQYKSIAIFIDNKEQFVNHLKQVGVDVLPI